MAPAEGAARVAAASAARAAGRIPAWARVPTAPAPAPAPAAAPAASFGVETGGSESAEGAECVWTGAGSALEAAVAGPAEPCALVAGPAEPSVGCPWAGPEPGSVSLAPGPVASCLALGCAPIPITERAGTFGPMRGWLAPTAAAWPPTTTGAPAPFSALAPPPVGAEVEAGAEVLGVAGRREDDASAGTGLRMEVANAGAGLGVGVRGRAGAAGCALVSGASRRDSEGGSWGTGAAAGACAGLGACFWCCCWLEVRPAPRSPAAATPAAPRAAIGTPEGRPPAGRCAGVGVGGPVRASRGASLGVPWVAPPRGLRTFSARCLSRTCCSSSFRAIPCTSSASSLRVGTVYAHTRHTMAMNTLYTYEYVYPFLDPYKTCAMYLPQHRVHGPKNQLPEDPVKDTKSKKLGARKLGARNQCKSVSARSAKCSRPTSRHIVQGQGRKGTHEEAPRVTPNETDSCGRGN